MTKTIPNYLRVHRGPQHAASTPQASASATTGDFWRAFSAATGWRVERKKVQGTTRYVLLPAFESDPISGAEELESMPVVQRSEAMTLAQSADQLVQQLDAARDAVRRQAAELSARAAIVSGHQLRETLADDLQKTLAEAAQACQCDSAAMYLLDDDTRYLKTRAVFGLPPSRIEQPPRELRGSRGDLEAMVQNVVLIDDLDELPMDTWSSPEPAGSAICAAICSGDVPIGTLWLFGNERADFSATHSASARIASTQLALLLQQAVTSREEHSRKNKSDVIRDLSHWQFTGLPVGTQLADGWLVDGMIESPQDWAIGWHCWDVLPDGSLMIAIAEAADSTLAGAMAAATTRAALTAHLGYRHTPSALMQRVSDTLWQSNAGEQLMSLLYLRVDPDTGEGEVAAAGNITAMISSRYGYRPLTDGKSGFLNSHINARCKLSTFQLQAGEALLAYGAGLGSDGATQMMLGDHLRTSMQATDAHPLASIRRSLADTPLLAERGAISIVRQ